MKITETMTTEARRAAIRTTTENRNHLITIHQNSSSPAETVAELIGRVGYRAARETIAEAVNARRDWDDIADVFRCPECGAVTSVDDWETLSLWEYFDDAFDVEFRVCGRARDALRSVCVMVAYGGPNIYVDTASKSVELYWWSERASYPISYEAAEIIDDWAAEYWGCM